MSDLVSIFDVHFGWPSNSALARDFLIASGATLEAGNIVNLRTDNLVAASVLRLVDDSLITAPALGAPDAGKAYEIAVAGGVWNVFAAGDIVEWDGAAWNLVVANAAGDPPDGTRAVIVEASAAGTLAGKEEQVLVCTTGTWAAGTAAPADGAKIDIVGANSIYNSNRYMYTGTHPTGAWAFLESGVQTIEGFVNLMTSVAVASPKTNAWLVLEGNDQFDGEFVGRVTALKIASGAVFKVKTAVADTLVPGEYVDAANGLFVKCDGTNHALGQVQWSNGTAGAGGELIVTGV